MHDFIYAEALRIPFEFSVKDREHIPVQQLRIGVNHADVIALDDFYTVVSALTDIF